MGSSSMIPALRHGPLDGIPLLPSLRHCPPNRMSPQLGGTESGSGRMPFRRRLPLLKPRAGCWIASAACSRSPTSPNHLTVSATHKPNAEEIKRRRLKCHLSRRKLAEKAGVNHKTLGKIENGETEESQHRTFEWLAGALTK